LLLLHHSQFASWLQVSTLDQRFQAVHEEHDGVRRRAFAALLARVESIEAKTQQAANQCPAQQVL
jgi:hypothetical protein